MTQRQCPTLISAVTSAERFNDLHLPYDAELDRQALLASGHDVTGHEVVFHGICTKCKQLH